MTTAFVIGNGISRKGIALDVLRQRGTIYGCNLLYTEFIPDVLVATDKPISAEIQNSGYPLKNRFHTRRPLEGLGALPVPKEYFGYSSGPLATAIASKDHHQHIYMLGFDMGAMPNNTFNNVYAGREFYKAPGSIPTFTGNWTRQIVKIATDHPRVKFFRVFGDCTAEVAEFKPLPNFYNLPLLTFLDRINNQKDL